MEDKKKIGEVVKNVLDGKKIKNEEINIAKVVKDEVIRIMVREELDKQRENADEWKMSMKNIIESGCMLNGD